MTPRYIAFKSILIVRKSISLEENAEQEIINLPEDAKIMFCTGGNNYAVKTTSDDFWFHVKDLPNHTERDAAWRLVEAEEKASFWRTYNDVRNFPESQQPIFHYMAQTNSLNWFFYTRRFGNWYRASMEGLKLLSTHLLCDACQMEPVSVACGHGCGKAQYCGQECANAHYDIHVADTCDRVSEKK
jgi:hypothetical protein